MRQLAEIVIITGMVTFFGSQWWLAGRAFRRSVFWGLAVLFVPVFFVVVRRYFKGSERQRRMYAHELDAPSAGGEA